MKITQLNSFYVVKNFSYHKQIKNELLDLIENSNYDSPYHEMSQVNISKADWFDASNMSRNWVKFLSNFLIKDLIEMHKEIGFDGFKINEIWFQQYFQNSEHGWHTHSSNFTNVYYLELPKNSPKTILLDPFDRKTKIEVDVKEGDLLMFPSYVLHKAPQNKGERKTIISYNSDATYSDTIYNKEL